MSNWGKNNKYTKSENRYKSKLDIKENVIEKSDADARLLDVMGNRENTDIFYFFLAS